MGSVAGQGVMMDISYIITPFAAWFVAGAIKFAINSILTKQPAFGLVGYGGLPSNHSAIVSSMASLIALKQGISHPAFGVALTLTFIVVLDAHSLRRQVGKHAKAINQLASSEPSQPILRERMGHTLIEISAGIMVGMAVAITINLV